MLSQGAKAVKSGKLLELAVSKILSSKDNISYEIQKSFKGIWGNTKMDHYIISPKTIAIECKYQGVSGTVDEKIPYCMLNLEKFDSDIGILVLEGPHFEKKIGIKKWAAIYAENNVKELKVMNLKELDLYIQKLI